MAEAPEETPTPAATEASAGEAGGEQTGKSGGGVNLAGLSYEGLKYTPWAFWSTVAAIILLIVGITRLGDFDLRDWDILAFLWMVWIIWRVALPNIKGTKFKSMGRGILWMTAWQVFWSAILLAGLYGCHDERALLMFSILFSAAILISNRLAIADNWFARSAREVGVALLLLAGLWAGREWSRPNFYRCGACRKVFTCNDDSGCKPNGYCAQTLSHKHQGKMLKRYNATQGIAQMIEWALEDSGLAKWTSASNVDEIQKRMVTLGDCFQGLFKSKAKEKSGMDDRKGKN